MAGRCPKADVVPPKLKAISWYHFALTFDVGNRLVVRDLYSTVGMRVIYDNADENAGRGFGVNSSAHGSELL